MHAVTANCLHYKIATHYLSHMAFGLPFAIIAHVL